MAGRQTRTEAVRDALADELRTGVYEAGDQLPNEDRLAERFDVSRATVREAVRGLIEGGYLARRHGVGTFVTGFSQRQHSLDATVSYTGMISGAGMVPGETVVARTERPATAEESAALVIPPRTVLTCVSRVRTADGNPVIYSEDRIPTDLLGDARQAPLDTSLYALLASAGLAIHHGVASLGPVVADERMATLLEVELGSALQFISEVDYTEPGLAVMLSDEWHVPGVFELTVNRRPAVPAEET
jgi:GntR family transcriptional regulator